ncbi:MAG: hypothetical protein A2W29_07825 [Gemmatimonadetes bacterium RBG_16_66_8]|nr:MAG: hypothetical protein A2W29_07825 [Gemmatimonadetes bacterium RBG_16_66_8]
MTLVIGVDAGASHTEALLAVDLTPVARQSGGPGAVSGDAVEQPTRVIVTLVRSLAQHAGGSRSIDALVVGAAGTGTEASRSALAAALDAARIAARVLVTTDGHIALQSAFGNEPGIVLSAGTGSIGLARDPAGNIRRTGGHGWRFGDEGSGYALARSGLSAAAKASDGRGPPTALSEMLGRAPRCADVAATLEWARAADVQQIAALATAVLDAADRGDAVASGLVKAAATDLAAHVHALLAWFPKGRGAPIALSGSLLAEGSPVRRAIVAALEPDSGRILLTNARVDPAAGAVALAQGLAR